MKKIAFTIVIAASAFGASAQEDWSTAHGMDLHSAGILGTRNNNSIYIKTNDTTRVVIDSAGNLRVPSWNYELPDGAVEYRPLYIDHNGNISARQISGQSISCNQGPTSWLLGGNTLPVDILTGGFVGNSNLLGHCSNAHLILEANGVKSLFLTPGGQVCVGQNNAYPPVGAVLDISDPAINSNTGVRDHFRIFADEYGLVRSSSDMHLVNTTGVFSIGNMNNSNTFPTGYNEDLRIELGAVGIGGYDNTKKLLVEGGSGDAIQAWTSNANAKGLEVVNNYVSKFAVFGNGKTNIGYQSGSGNNAFLNVNVAGSSTPGNAIDVFDQYSNKVNFRVKTNGDVYARYVKVTVNAIPDYVFASDYKLPTLKEVEDYYSTNKHLPEVPSASEFEKDGMDLGEMNKLLLKKVEELTIYVVEQNKKTEALQQKVKELEGKK